MTSLLSTTISVEVTSSVSIAMVVAALLEVLPMILIIFGAPVVATVRELLVAGAANVVLSGLILVATDVMDSNSLYLALSPAAVVESDGVFGVTIVSLSIVNLTGFVSVPTSGIEFIVVILSVIEATTLLLLVAFEN